MYTPVYIMSTPMVVYIDGMDKDTLISQVKAAVEENKRALAEADRAASAQREAIYAALDGGVSIAETCRITGLSRTRINVLIQRRKAETQKSPGEND